MESPQPNGNADGSNHLGSDDKNSVNVELLLYKQ